MTEYCITETDVGDVVLLEHINLEIEDQILASIFYCEGMGLTRDPFEKPSVPVMWINVGLQQFHLKLLKGGKRSQKIDGNIVMVFPDLDALSARLKVVESKLEGTQFAHKLLKDSKRGIPYLEIVGPYGNVFKCYANDKKNFSARGSLGIVQLELFCRSGAAQHIVNFYENVLGAISVKEEGKATIVVGPNQRLVFEEREEPPIYDGWHIGIYITRFAKVFKELERRNLIFVNSNSNMDDSRTLEEAIQSDKYRFKDLVKEDTNEVIHELEHEIRPVRHRQYMRTLVNRFGTVGIYCNQ